MIGDVLVKHLQRKRASVIGKTSFVAQRVSPGRFRLQVRIAEIDGVVVEVAAGDEVIEVQLADGAFYQQPKLVRRRLVVAELETRFEILKIAFVGLAVPVLVDGRQLFGERGLQV